ncbi:MAG: HAMP domain-containing histidine kinase [Bifidobacteriaceae bacterium]|jgi:signal transduction histidine kinase|nr:HAMP domain-containing histidine kinase [Bifidobacteriaceae bacterium]
MSASKTPQRPEQNSFPKPRLRDLPKPLGMMAVIFWALTVGRFLANLIFKHTGQPSALVAYLISVALGIVVMLALIFIFGLLMRFHPDRRIYFGQEILDAMSRMAQGDFAIRLRRQERHPLSEIIDGVNQLAADLGDLEEHRQNFVSAVSHEIQSPLTSISGFAQLLKQSQLDEATRTHYLDVITQETQRLSELSDNLLRLTALESDDVSLKPQSFRLDEQLRSVILALEPQWAAKPINVSLQADEAEIVADESLWRQVWSNLVQNAIKFTQADGNVEITLQRADQFYQVVVSDNGIGIGQTDLPHVFERFYRADKARSSGGNGLGLALVKGLCQLGGGRVTVTSRVGEGSQFTVYIPLTPP